MANGSNPRVITSGAQNPNAFSVANAYQYFRQGVSSFYNFIAGGYSDPNVGDYNIAKDAFNSGTGAAYGALDQAARRPTGPHFSTTSGKWINTTDLRGAKVLGGIGNVVGCTLDAAESAQNVANGDYKKAIVNGCACAGGVIGGVAGGVIGGVAGSALLGPGTAVGGVGGAVLGGYVTGKAYEYVCDGLLPNSWNSSPVSPAVSPVTVPKTVGVSPTPPIGTPDVIATGNVAQVAASTLRFRPSVDYSGADGAYAVSKGQTLTAIAQSNGITLDELKASNPQIADPNSIRIGQVIRLPSNASGYQSGSKRSL